MKIEHVAVWVSNLEQMRTFYTDYFGGKAGTKYHNPNKNFASYFISFEDGCRLELMQKEEISKKPDERDYLGITHFAFSVGSKQKVNELTDQLSRAGFTVIGHPRLTGDGYYESVILDPENNRIEITI